MTRLTSTIFAFLALLIGGTAAQAQGYPAPPQQTTPSTTVNRDGFTIGLSLGVGVLTLDECQECDALVGAGADFHIGLMVNPQLAIQLEGFVVLGKESGATVSQAITMVAAQFWVTPNLWVKGGLGVGDLEVGDDEGNVLARSEQAGGGMVGVGYEVMQHTNYVIDLSLRIAALAYDRGTITQTAVTAGVSWY